jgi:hypothetical protein
VAQALVGLAMTAVILLSGGTFTGAAGAVVGEMAGELYLKTQTPTAGNANQLINTTAGIGRISGGLAGLAAGGDVNTGANVGTVASENNAAFAIPLAIAGATAYAAWQGDGNPVEGFREIGKGNDPVSQGTAALVEKGVTLSAEHFPEQTAQVLQALSTVDALKDQAIDVIDNATGQRISGTLNSIPPHIRESLLGAAKAYSLVIPAAAVTKVNQAAKVAQAASKVDGPSITLYGFRGAGKHLNADGIIHPYQYSGHVGYSFDKGKQIWGFGPAAGKETISETIENLKAGQSYPGVITQDQDVFKLVEQNPLSTRGKAGILQSVYELNIPVSQERFDSIKTKHDTLASQQQLDHIRYQWPTDPMPNNAFNCATFPSCLGIPIPENTGKIQSYMSEFERMGKPW